MTLVIRRATGQDGTEKFYVFDTAKGTFTRDKANAVFSDYAGAHEHLERLKDRKKQHKIRFV